MFTLLGENNCLSSLAERALGVSSEERQFVQDALPRLKVEQKEYA